MQQKTWEQKTGWPLYPQILYQWFHLAIHLNVSSPLTFYSYYRCLKKSCSGVGAGENTILNIGSLSSMVTGIPKNLSFGDTGACLYSLHLPLKEEFSDLSIG